MMAKSVLPASRHAALLRMTADIITAYLKRHDVPAEHVTRMKNAIVAELRRLATTEAYRRAVRAGRPAGESPSPAIAIAKSITPTYLICLEDGRRHRNLGRHLLTAHRMQPDEYRRRWGLPARYPMLAPRYRPKRPCQSPPFPADRDELTGHPVLAGRVAPDGDMPLTGIPKAGG
jgi:predicted transcriptional regulator